MLKLISLLFCLLLSLPAWADDPYSRFLTQYGSLGAVGVNSNRVVTFATGTSPANQQTVNAAIASFDWTVHPEPDTYHMSLAIAQDTTIPAAALIDVAKLSGVMLQTSYATLPILQAMWTQLIAFDGQAAVPATALTPAILAGPLYGNCSDGTPIITKIQNYAKSFNCPLTAN